ncbi:MAG: ATP-binding cassette domain-containing protein [Planctomycetota bacterium]|nr:ATP-binding cassette domain-containing protein [Planctomycetota bacterium]MEC9348957.1 ATP-binding cassette domain-containing protein [Planctomycetota bacterium]MEE3229469.1 ATP-binding cassette domain-containing protein [Planctomycetota bacterium]
MISVKNLSLAVGEFTLENVSFEIPTRAYCALMGKTGCGKTTVLEAICGLRNVSSGSIRLMSREVAGLPPAARGIGFVPQDGALFSTMTVEENLGFSLAVRGRPKEVVSERVGQLADLLGISGLLGRRIQGLSGGEKQRVALGRALAFEPGILCLDEPLSALDDDTKEGLIDLLGKVREETGVTTLHITHSLREARSLCDMLLVMEDSGVRELPLEGEA